MDCCKVTAQLVGDAVLKRAQEFDTKSKLRKTTTPTSDEDGKGTLEWKDLVVGDLLGEGTFSSVYQVAVPSWSSKQGKGNHDDSSSFALKILRSQVFSSQSTFKSGAIDLVIEARMLERLQHPNIVKLHSTKGGCLSKSFSQGGYFLVLERLSGTLHESLRKWETKQQASQKPRLLVLVSPTIMSYDSKEEQEQVPPILERLQDIALGVARAMEYLHSKNICFRDLKPQNVGFTQDGTVRLFDFGLAVELENKSAHALSKGRVGTTRYMAPENALCKPYGLPCDVYSFGHLLWEVCTLKVAYKKLSPNQHTDRVVLGKERPSLKGHGLSPELKQLMKECWIKSPESRPEFTEICNVLQEELKSHFYSSKSSQSSTKKLLKRSESMSPHRGQRNVAFESEFEAKSIKKPISRLKRYYSYSEGENNRALAA